MPKRQSANLPVTKNSSSALATKPKEKPEIGAILQRVENAPSTLRPGDVLHMQRAIGNRATRQMIQTKLTLGPANDAYEQEADQVAKEVVRASRQPAVQRESADEDELQMKPLADRISQVQRSYLAPLRVQREGMEEEELQAKRVESVQREGMEEDELQAKRNPSVQREGMEEEELQASPNHGMEGGDVDADVASTIQSAKGGGQPLHDGVRSSMEQGFGADFSGVRVHTGSQADALNRSLNARAFTTGSDIFFGKGQYNPGSTGGQELIAHELTHTVQQSAAGVQRNVVQRAVGFEMEDGAWSSFQRRGGIEETSSDEVPVENLDSLDEIVVPKVPKYGDRTFAFGIILDNEENLRERDMQRLLSLIPGLALLREHLKSNQHSYSERELEQSAAMWINGKKNNPFMGNTEEEQKHNFFLALKLFDEVMSEVFETEAEAMNEDDFILDEETRKEMADILGALIAQTLTPISRNDMTDNQLSELRKEFAGTNIFSTKKPQGNHIDNIVSQFGLEAAGKKGALHTESDFKIEADGPYEQGRMDIEFVTSPFEESANGYSQLKAVLKRVRKITEHIGKKAGRDYNVGTFVEPSETGFSQKDVYLAGGRAHAGFKMQVTQGIPLSEIPTLMKMLGSDVEGESTKQERNRAPARRMMRGNKKDNRDTRAMGQSPKLADNVIDFLRPTIPGAEVSNLRGFLSYIILYILQLEFSDPEGIKLRLPLMSRFSFDNLAKQLPPEQQVWLSNNFLVVGDLLEKEIRTFQPNFSLGRPMINITGVPSEFKLGGHQQFFEMMKTLTVNDWLNGIFAFGEDRLVASNMKTYLAQMGQDYAKYDKSISIFLRGHANADNLVGKVDDLAIMENRDINPKDNADLTMDQTEEIALAYMKFMIKLRKAKPGKKEDTRFPNLKKI